MRKVWLAVIVALAACSENTPKSDVAHEDKSICQEPPRYIGRSEDCMHRTAYQYARAGGTNSELARAVAQKCDGYVLDNATEITTAMHGGDITGIGPERDENYRELQALAKEEALRRIVEAKAGHCNMPLPIDEERQRVVDGEAQRRRDSYRNR